MSVPLATHIKRSTPPSAPFPKGLVVGLEPPNLITIRDPRHRNSTLSCSVEVLYYVLAARSKEGTK